MAFKNLPAESRTERKKEDTRQRIISAALKLFKKYGFTSATMEQIAQEADIAKGTLYNYFPVKEAILSEFIKRSFSNKNPDRLKQLQSLPDTRSRMISIITELMEGVRSQKEIFEKFLIYRVQNILSLDKKDSERSGIELLAEEIVNLGQKSGEIRSDLPKGIILDFFEFVFIEVVKQFYLDPEHFRDKETIELCSDLYLNAVCNPINKKHI